MMVLWIKSIYVADPDPPNLLWTSTLHAPILFTLILHLDPRTVLSEDWTTLATLFASVWDPMLGIFFKETLFGNDTVSVVGLGATGLAGTGNFVGFLGATTGLLVGFLGATIGFFVGFGFVGAFAEAHVNNVDATARREMIINGSRFNRTPRPETGYERVLSDVTSGTAVWRVWSPLQSIVMVLPTAILINFLNTEQIMNRGSFLFIKCCK
jgi:hypothetical protein